MLLNNYTLNEHELWYAVAPTILDQDDIVFDGYSLQNTEIITETLNYDDLGIVDFNTFNFPRNNWGGVISKYYRGRKVTFKSFVKESTSTALNDKLDEIKNKLATTEWYLDIRVNSEIRRVKATCTNLDYKRQHYHVTFIPLDITFTILEPFFYAITSQSASYLSKTGTFSEEFTSLGTAATEPTIYFIFWVSTVTSMVITNPDTTTMTITTSLWVSDVLIIDSKNKVVTKNGTEIDYSGVFPLFQVWSNPFTVTITGSVNVDVTVITPKNYL